MKKIEFVQRPALTPALSPRRGSAESEFFFPKSVAAYVIVHAINGMSFRSEPK